MALKLLYFERFLISVVDRIEYGWRVAVDLVVTERWQVHGG
jgi:hypothetical protein